MEIIGSNHHTPLRTLLGLHDNIQTYSVPQLNAWVQLTPDVAPFLTSPVLPGEVAVGDRNPLRFRLHLLSYLCAHLLRGFASGIETKEVNLREHFHLHSDLKVRTVLVNKAAHQLKPYYEQVLHYLSGYLDKSYTPIIEVDEDLGPGLVIKFDFDKEAVLSLPHDIAKQIGRAGYKSTSEFKDLVAGQAVPCLSTSVLAQMIHFEEAEFIVLPGGFRYVAKNIGTDLLKNHTKPSDLLHRELQIRMNAQTPVADWVPNYYSSPIKNTGPCALSQESGDKRGSIQMTYEINLGQVDLPSLLVQAGSKYCLLGPGRGSYEDTQFYSNGIKRNSKDEWLITLTISQNVDGRFRLHCNQKGRGGEASVSRGLLELVRRGELPPVTVRGQLSTANIKDLLEFITSSTPAEDTVEGQAYIALNKEWREHKSWSRRQVAQEMVKLVVDELPILLASAHGHPVFKQLAGMISDGTIDPESPSLFKF